ncbi:hypothetical protein P3L10_032216 [Capsicum annuum]
MNDMVFDLRVLLFLRPPLLGRVTPNCVRARHISILGSSCWAARWSELDPISNSTETSTGDPKLLTHFVSVLISHRSESP